MWKETEINVGKLDESIEYFNWKQNLEKSSNDHYRAIKINIWNKEMLSKLVGRKLSRRKLKDKKEWKNNLTEEVVTEIDILKDVPCMQFVSQKAEIKQWELNYSKVLYCGRW